MSDDIKPKASQDFSVVAVDGAYVHVVEGIVNIQVYRDVSIPVPDKYGIPTFSNKERTIRHEIRMSVEAARRLSHDLDKAIPIYLMQVLEHAGFKEINIQEIGKKVHEKSMKEYDASSLVSRKINEMVGNLDIEGKKKIVALLDQLIVENASRFQEISIKHSLGAHGK